MFTGYVIYHNVFKLFTYLEKVVDIWYKVTCECLILSEWLCNNRYPYDFTIIIVT